jgi:hypothetical protein
VKKCPSTHPVTGAQCQRDDDEGSHATGRHVSLFSATRIMWEISPEDMLRWNPVTWPEFDADPTRRMSVADLFAHVTQQRVGHGSPDEVKVVVATGSPKTPWANVMAFTTVTFPDGARAVVLEL